MNFDLLSLREFYHSVKIKAFQPGLIHLGKIGRLGKPCLGILEFFALLAVIPTIAMMWADVDDRRRSRESQAWELLAIERSGNFGKRESLEYLNSRKDLIWTAFDKDPVSLSGLNLSTLERPGAYLVGLSLDHSNLRSTNFKNANLTGARITQSILKDSSFKDAILDEALFENINAENVDLSSGYTESIVSSVKFSDVVLKRSCLVGRTISGDSFVIYGSDLREARLALSAELSTLFETEDSASKYIINSDVSGFNFYAKAVRTNVLEDSRDELRITIEKNIDLLMGSEVSGRKEIEIRAYSGSSVAWRLNPSWYLKTNPPKGIDLSNLEGLNEKDYMKRRNQVFKANPFDGTALHQEFPCYRS